VDSSRQPSSRVMRSVCAPVMAAGGAGQRLEHADRLDRRVVAVVQPLLAAAPNSCSAPVRRSTAPATAGRAPPTPRCAAPRGCSRRWWRARCRSAWRPGSARRRAARPWRPARWAAPAPLPAHSSLSQASSGCDDWSSPLRHCSASRASRAEFSVRSVYRPSQNRFSAERLVTVRPRCEMSTAGCSWCSRLVVSTSPSVSTQVSALLPPRCMVAISSEPPAMRVRPPGSTRHEPGPSETANTRRMSERGVRRPPFQVGICDSGR
jgi:hypothetical protein